LSAARDEARRKRTTIELIGLGVLLAVGVLASVILSVRYGVLLPQARVFIEARTNGLKVGRLGRLQIEGLSGDIFHDLTVRRLTIRDEEGVWLEADNLHLTWYYTDLLRRRFHADRITVDEIRVLKRPTLTAKGKDTGLPVSFQIDQASGRVVLMPAFSYARGVYDLNLKLDVGRSGGARGQMRAVSVLRAGDHLNADFDVGAKRPLLLNVDIVEARGGALAGALGLPPNQPFTVKVAAAGHMAEGQFTAAAALGAHEPLRAQGSWTKDGGVGTARLSLTASTLTAPFAHRFGPDANFVLAGRRAGPGSFALDARVATVNFKLRAWGLGDLGDLRLGPKGLQLDAAADSLSRITGGPEVGPGRVVGRLTQAADGWRFAGSGAISQAKLEGYSLAQASGPIEISERAGEWTAKAALSGAGGRGTGLAAAALGPAPRATFEGSRLADGRLALRALQVTGQGLKLEASGNRGLLGGLTFKGGAQVSNLAAARTGAAGSASATWSASQGKAGQPWALDLNVKGERFATGYPELDRLLGSKPQAHAQGSVQGRRLALASGSLTGAALKANVAGLLEADGALSFKLDWSAEGPFRAGPVEIAGRAKGTGALTGTLGAPRADLIADLPQIDAPRLPLRDAHVTLSFLSKPDGSSGMIAATAGSAYGPARGRADFRFPTGGVDLTGVSIDAGGVKASGSLSLRSRAPSAADLEVAITHGALLDAGQVAGTVKISEALGGAPGGARAVLNLAAENARLVGGAYSIRNGRLTADGPMARLPYQVKAQGSSPGGAWALNGRGVAAQSGPAYAVSFDGDGGLGGRNLRTLETAQFRFGGPERSGRLRLAASDGGRLDLDARFTDTAADVRAQLTGIGLGLIDEDLAGRTDATLTVQGRGGRLDGVLDAKLAGARGRGAPVASGIDGTLRGRLAGDTLSLDMAASNTQGLAANANLVLPTESSAAPFRIAIARTRPLQGRFSAQGEVSPLWDLLVGGERSLSGRVRSAGTLGGTLADPRATGQIAVEAGRFDDGATGLSLRNVSLKAAFADNAVDVTQASGVDGRGGSVAGAGRISLLREGASSFRLDLKGFRLIDNDLASASASGRATIDRAADGKVRLTGDLAIDRADVTARLPTPSGVVAMDVIEKNRPLDLPASLPPASVMGDGWALDVKLHAPRGVYLRGRGLDVELSLDAHVGGTTARPDLTGVARVVRGDYDFSGKRFTFDTQSVVYLSTQAEAVRLDLIATRDDPSLTATVRIRGTAARPQVSLASTPSLPNDEILSQVLFGASAAQLSPLEAAQLASALASLSGGGGLDVIGNLRAFAGLDRLALGGGNASGVTVSGGKYLTENVYLELTGGGRTGPAAQVEWRVKKGLSILSRIASQGDGRLAIRWRRDY
jgi:translocation and assembly module TamB